MCAQFVVGLSWTTVFFAFMMTHFQQTLSKPGGSPARATGQPPDASRTDNTLADGATKAV
jgi:hypothetical protein